MYSWVSAKEGYLIELNPVSLVWYATFLFSGKASITHSWHTSHYERFFLLREPSRDQMRPPRAFLMRFLWSLKLLSCDCVHGPMASFEYGSMPRELSWMHGKCRGRRIVALFSAGRKWMGLSVSGDYGKRIEEGEVSFLSAIQTSLFSLLLRHFCIRMIWVF